jgi:hypothetical protein
MAIIRDHDMDDGTCWKQAPERMGDWADKSVSLADLDCFCTYVGATAYEHCPLDCLRAKSFKVE